MSEQEQTELLNFIEDHWDEYDHTRAMESDSFRKEDFVDDDEQSRENFLLTQGYILEAAQDNEELSFLTKLKDFIEGGRIKLMDKEDNSAWLASGFILDKNGNVVIFHER